ncbi:hypothetical protein GCM10028775_35230 [Catellatospora paridis]
MDSGKAREIFKQYASATVYVAVESEAGDQAIGSAFHVGEGVFVTARHVVEGKQIVEVASTEETYVPLTGADAEVATSYVHINNQSTPVHWISQRSFQLERGPYFHSDESGYSDISGRRHRHSAPICLSRGPSPGLLRQKRLRTN